MPQKTPATQIKVKPSVGRVIVTILSVVFLISVFVLFGFIALTAQS